MSIAGMPASLPAALNDRDDQFAVLIAQRNLRSQQVRSAHVAAAQVRAVTAPAIDAEQRLPACDLRGIARRTLLPGNKSSHFMSGGCICSSRVRRLVTLRRRRLSRGGHGRRRLLRLSAIRYHNQ